jgi:hypothetical protein
MPNSRTTNFEPVHLVYDDQGEIQGVYFHPALQGKELEAVKAQFFALLRSAINEEEQN